MAALPAAWHSTCFANMQMSVLFAVMAMAVRLGFFGGKHHQPPMMDAALGDHMIGQMPDIL